jgi:hypothetical protein
VTLGAHAAVSVRVISALRTVSASWTGQTGASISLPQQVVVGPTGTQILVDGVGTSRAVRPLTTQVGGGGMTSSACQTVVSWWALHAVAKRSQARGRAVGASVAGGGRGGARQTVVAKRTDSGRRVGLDAASRAKEASVTVGACGRSCSAVCAHATPDWRYGTVSALVASRTLGAGHLSTQTVVAASACRAISSGQRALLACSALGAGGGPDSCPVARGALELGVRVNAGAGVALGALDAAGTPTLTVVTSSAWGLGTGCGARACVPAQTSHHLSLISLHSYNKTERWL